MFNQSSCYENIEKLSMFLYTFFNGKKHMHSEVMQKAEEFMPIMGIQKDSPEYIIVLNGAVEEYEKEVGVKLYEPFVLAKNKNADLWLYKAKPTTSHAFFNRYKQYLKKDGFTMKTIENIETTCEKILAYCANPKCESKHEQKRGLVVGDVQSGKTANYLALINMAYDYGYKIVLLLAGMTDSLRTQTQKRTDKGVIGAISDTIGNDIKYCGVGLVNEEHYVVPFTNQSNDFAKFIQQNSNAAISDFKKPVVLVVKKNKKILESVIEQLQSALKDFDSSSILIIDDEADNASISTAPIGKDPTTINRCIRAIFNKFPIASYVGYTATPFANIFINPVDENKEDLDLFPSDFIVQLNSPDTYFGGYKVFPKEDTENLPRPLRIVDEDEYNFLPVKHTRYDDYPGMADTLKEAIHCFLINNVVRTLRGNKPKHRTLMINISTFNDMQDRIYDKVLSYVTYLKNIIEQTSYMSVEKFIRNEDMKKIYDLFNYDEFFEQIKHGNTEENYLPVSWEQVQQGLYDEIKDLLVVTINSKNGNMDQKKNGKKQRFDYEEFDEVGARVIAIGGMVLSRGLTLEGLMVSYYSRNAGAYDTLLQMCRWFGYRPKYEDLCRVYMTQVNVDRFVAALDAVDDLKSQFAEMELQGKSPKDFGLMVKESPDTLETTLLISARNKTRHTDKIDYHLNYGGVYADTSKLSKDPEINKRNIKEFINFYNSLSWDDVEGRYMSRKVSKFTIAEFVRKLKIPYINRKFNTENLADYIENSDLFLSWDVVIANGDSKEPCKLNGEITIPVDMVKRSFHTDDEEDLYIRIGGSNNRVMDPGILDSGFREKIAGKKLDILKNKPLNKKGQPFKDLTARDYLRERDCPILVIFPIDLKTSGDIEKKNIKGTFDGNPLLAFAIGFPEKQEKVMIRYRINKVKIKELTEGLEIEQGDEEGEEEDD